MRFRLVCFDLDGVLTQHISSWVWVHDHFGVDNEVSYDAYMKNEIDDLEFMRRDIALWRREQPGISRDDVALILRTVPLNPGAAQLMTALKEQGITVGIISGGIDLLAERIADQLGMDFAVANGLESASDGTLTGEGISRVPLRDKGVVVAKISERFGVPAEAIAAVGDTYIDIPMFRAGSYGIAFNPSDDRVRSAADDVVEGNDLTRLIPLLT